jgi:hypothetical protein
MQESANYFFGIHDRRSVPSNNLCDFGIAVTVAHGIPAEDMPDNRYTGSLVFAFYLLDGASVDAGYTTQQ